MMTKPGWPQGSPRFFWLGLAVLSAGIGCRPTPPGKPQSSAAPAVKAASREDVDRFCGGCHRPPRPADFARRDWREEVTQGYGLHAMSARVDLIPPPLETVVAYFEQNAPQELDWRDSRQISEEHQPSAVSFTPLTVTASGDAASAIARIDRPDDKGPFSLSDMRNGHVWTWSPADTTARLQWTVPHPAAVCAAHLGADRQAGYVIADLGSFLPEDHQRGKLWWVAADGSDDPVPLVEDLGRVSHVSCDDLDGDGLDDLIVSEFGWRRTGRLQILWGTPSMNGPATFVAEVLDPRHGVLRTEVRDVDGDGFADIVVAFAQEHESIEIYRGQGQRKFEQYTVDQAPHPAWGTSDFLCTDLDADGRLDIVVCHGDSFDGAHLRPQHGVTWLRQAAPWTFEKRPLAGLPGAHRAVPGDLDADGDLDLAVVSLLPERRSAAGDSKRLVGVAWLEQQTTGQFVPHVIEWDHCQHATCEVADIDQDGDLDILAGQYLWSGSDPTVLTIFRNDGQSMDRGSAR